MEEVIQLPCKHVYHKACCELWLKRSRMCPMCKDDVAVALQARLDRAGNS